MSKKKRRGASFVMVVILVAFIFTTGSAMLTLVNFDFRARITKSEKVKNMYEADSGLNLVKNIIMKEANIAILVANNKTMAEKIKGTTQDGLMYYKNNAFVDSKIYDDINRYFKYNFIGALTDAADKTDFKAVDITNDPNYSSNRLLDSIKNLYYYDFDQSKTDGINTIKSIDEGIKGGNFKKIDLKSSAQNPEIKITRIEVSKPAENQTTYTDYHITLTVESTFESISSTKTVSGKKTITSKYTINAPEFRQALKAKAQEVDVNQYSFLRAITADGNINVGDGSSTTNLNVTGGIWEKGEYSGKLTDGLGILGYKYSNGIIVNNANFNVYKTPTASKYDGNTLGNIYTNGSVSLINSSNVNVAGSIYSRNVYAGIVGSVSQSTNNKLIATNVITNNDLVMNSNNSTFTINNSYYGINDVNEDVTKTNGVNGENGSKADQSVLALESSSIIVNSTKNKNVIDIDNAYISGVAYLSLADSNSNKTTYQIGESVAVDGNYSAYQDILPSYESSTVNKVTLTKYSDYSLLDGSVYQKSDYFDYYYSKDKGGKIADAGGVQIKNLYSIGASVNKKDSNADTTVSNRTLDTDMSKNIIAPMKSKYAQNVLLMENTQSYDPMQVYTGSNVVRSVCGSLINFDKYNNDHPDKTLILSMKGILPNQDYEYIFNSDASKKIKITANGVYVGDESQPRIEAAIDNSIDPVKKVIKAVIITQGDVVVDNTQGNSNDEINLYGSIISGGNVNIAGDKINIVYDERNVKLTVADMIDFHNALKNYIEVPSETSKVVNGTALVTATSTVDTSIQRYGASLLKEGLWTLRVKKDENS